MKHIPKWLKLSLYVLADFSIFILVSLLIFLDYVQGLDLENLVLIILVASLIKIGFLYIFNIYQMITSQFGIIDALKIMFVSFIFNTGYLIFIFFSRFELTLLPALFLFISEAFLLTGIRLARRLVVIFITYQNSDRSNKQRTLIIGAGAAGKIIIDELRTNPILNAKPIVVVDDDPTKINRRFLNLRVEGPIANVSTIIKAYRIQQVVIAIGTISRARLFDILRYLQKDAVKIRRLPLIEELGKNKQSMAMQDVDIHELLGRDVVPLINDEIKSFIKNQIVLITGAGGSIGGELTRQIFHYEPKQLILFDIYENGVYDVQQELVKLNKNRTHPIPVSVVIGSTYNRERLEAMFNLHRPNLVFHAAAYKHVPLMEDSPQEAIRTNILGTYNIADLSQQYNVTKMVLVSTDKAVRPTNVMGATKYYAETIIRHFAKISKTTNYGAVRFGNVLASNGSVIPLFKKQIESGGPVTVTDPNITRYFMTIPEAVGLILQSGVYAKAGEIFVLDMGKPVKIIDLAEKMIRQSGYVPYEEIQIEFTGLRPGEKMYEELLLDSSKIIKTPNEKIFIDRTEQIVFDKNMYHELIEKAMANHPQVAVTLFQNIKLKEQI
jgi:FlaA1/EpsC-like NDP-sugar epimerase